MDNRDHFTNPPRAFGVGICQQSSEEGLKKIDKKQTTDRPHSEGYRVVVASQGAAFLFPQSPRLSSRVVYFYTSVLLAESRISQKIKALGKKNTPCVRVDTVATSSSFLIWPSSSRTGRIGLSPIEVWLIVADCDGVFRRKRKGLGAGWLVERRYVLTLKDDGGG